MCKRVYLKAEEVEKELQEDRDLQAKWNRIIFHGL